MVQFATRQVHAAQIRALKPRSPQIGAFEIASLQQSAGQVESVEDCAGCDQCRQRTMRTTNGSPWICSFEVFSYPACFA